MTLKINQEPKSSILMKRDSLIEIIVMDKQEKSFTKEKNPFTNFKNIYSEEKFSSSTPLKKIDSNWTSQVFDVKSKRQSFKDIKESFINNNSHYMKFNDLLNLLCEDDIDLDFIKNLILNQHSFINHNKLISILMEKKDEHEEDYNKSPIGLKTYAELWFVLKINKEILLESFSKSIVKFLSSFNENEKDDKNNSDDEDEIYSRRRANTKAESKVKNKDELINLYKKLNSIYLSTNTISIQNIIEYEKIPKSLIPKLDEKTYFCILNWGSIEIARQLTLCSYYQFYNITSLELVDYSWRNKNLAEKSNKIICPNIYYILERINRLTNFFIEEILSYDFPGQRALIMIKLIDIAEELLKINNYHDFMTVISIFDSIQVTNLTETFLYMKENYRLRLIELIKFKSPMNQYIEIRTMVKKAYESSIEYIPSLIIILYEIEKIKEDPIEICPSGIESEKMININRIIQTGKIIKVIDQVKAYLYCYRPVFKLSFLYDPKPKDEKALMELSCLLEPRFDLYENQIEEKRVTHNDKYNTKINNTFSEVMNFIEDIFKNHNDNKNKKFDKLIEMLKK